MFIHYNTRPIPQMDPEQRTILVRRSSSIRLRANRDYTILHSPRLELVPTLCSALRRRASARVEGTVLAPLSGSGKTVSAAAHPCRKGRVSYSGPYFTAYLYGGDRLLRRPTPLPWPPRRPIARGCRVAMQWIRIYLARPP